MVRGDAEAFSSDERSILCTLHLIVVIMFMLLAGVKRIDIPYGLKAWNKVQSLQGIFNILVFTRPHNPNLGYFAALKKVLLVGCDDDQTEQDRRRSSTVARNLRASVALANSSALDANPTKNDVVMNEDMSPAAMMRAAKKAKKAAREERLRNTKKHSGSAVTQATAMASAFSRVSALDFQQEISKNAESDNKDVSSNEKTFEKTAITDQNQSSPDELV